jgi:DNA-binding CsgD family transcriptional regulator/tetratricopeptide (TPR) repeat protein
MAVDRWAAPATPACERRRTIRVLDSARDVIWPLIGRHEELDFLASNLDAPGSAGVFLSGPMGVGKSRLAREALAQAGARGAMTVPILATRATASIPLAAVAHLIGDTVPPSTAPVGLFRIVCRNLTELSDGRPVVLGVDDAHLLDSGTAALVLHLVTTGTARVVVTARRGEPCADAVTTLWKDGHVARLDLTGLSGSDAVAMAEAHLGGPLDREARRWIKASCRGSPLYVRELVTGAVQAGTVHQREAVWHMEGTPRLSRRLVELVEENLGDLPAKDRWALELVALAEPVELRVLNELVDTASIARLERRGLVVITGHGPATTARCAHPLYGDVIAEQLGGAAARALRQALAEAFEHTGRRHRGDALRLVTWRLEADGTADPEVLTEAAAEASRRFDHALAARLADAALAAGAGTTAAMLQAYSASCLGRLTEADDLLARWEGCAADEAEGANYLLHRMRTLHWGLGRTAEGLALLDRAAQWWPTSSWRQRIASHRLYYCVRDETRLSEAVRIGALLLEEPDLPEDIRTVVTALLALALAMLGRSHEAVALADSVIAAVPRPNRGGGSPVAVMVIRAWCDARLYAGEGWDAVEARLRRLHGEINDQDSTLAGIPELALGRLALKQGRITEARSWLAEALRRVEDAGDPFLVLTWVMTMLSHAEARAGEPAGAAATLARAEDVLRRHGAIAFDAIDAPLAEVWIAAGDGELTRAGEIALAAADGRSENRVGEVTLLHAAVSVGVPPALVGSRLRAVVIGVDSDWCQAMGAHVTALEARDGEGLDAAAHRFEQIGALLQAAEAFADAAVAHGEAGKKMSSRASASHHDRLIDACAGVSRVGARRTPKVKLSAREREVALLAGRGLSNREIAERLSLSVRTVESHVYRVCTRLGVTRRDALASLIAPPADPASPAHR